MLDVVPHDPRGSKASAGGWRECWMLCRCRSYDQYDNVVPHLKVGTPSRSAFRQFLFYLAELWPVCVFG